MIAPRASQTSRVSLLATAAAGSALVALSIFVLIKWESRGLPSVGEIKTQYRNHFPAAEPRHWVPLFAISPRLRSAVIISEDWSFYRHGGYDYGELWQSFLTDVRMREFRRGGSTITQQLAKNVYVGPEKTLHRKMAEAIVTRRIERALSKDEILESYLNIADWGEGIIGAGAAAHFYFAKTPDELTWSEAALLAAILPNPHRFNPLANPNQSARLRHLVLLKLLVNLDITPEEYSEGVCSPLWRGLNPPNEALHPLQDRASVADGGNRLELVENVRSVTQPASAPQFMDQ
jgi:monofunctional biosynthetic peptidoglycan transglycosylase